MPKEKLKEQIINELNKALEVEYSAIIMYLHHAEFVTGLNAEPIIERLKEIASDEEKHRDMIRERIVVLGGVPSTKLGDLKISQSDNIKEMLKYELKEELVAVKLYQKILGLVKQLDNSETLYHSIYHLIQDEQEHVEELKRLLAIK